MSAPKQEHIFELSKCMRQCVESSSGGRYWVFVQSTRMTARAWDLIVVWGLWRMVWLAILMAHLASRPEASRQPMISPVGAADHGDGMLLKILLQLLGSKVHAVTHLLVVRVVQLGGGKHLAQVVDRALDGLDLALLWSLDRQAPC